MLQYILPTMQKHRQIIQQFIHFACVGGCGFLVDWASTALLRICMPLQFAVLIAYIIASSNNWLLNRLWTFKKSCRVSTRRHHQWIKFIAANIPGFIINRSIVLTLLSLYPIMRQWTVIALFCGTLGGMFINFILCRYFVFAQKTQ